MRHRILIVSANTSLFDLVNTVAHERKQCIEYAETPLEAIELIKGNRIRVVFIDIYSYENLANELAYEIKRIRPTIVVAYMSQTIIINNALDFDFVLTREEDALKLIK